MTQPNFLIIGAMKAGTTSLSRYLHAHPQVFMSRPKELHFFTEEYRWSRGIDWYEERFRDAAGAVAIGEASVSYTMYPRFKGVPGRIARVLPNVRLVYLMRDPIERMRSHYLHYRYPAETVFTIHRREKRSIGEALLSDREYGYVDTSRYALQVEQYLEHIARDAILLVTSEELKNNRAEVMRRVYRFLEVDEDFTPPNLGREYLRTADRRAPRPWLLAVRRRRSYRAAAARVYPAIGRRFPRTMRAGASRLSTRMVDPRLGEISETLRRELADLVRDDVSRLRAYMPAGFDGWGIVEPRPAKRSES